MTNALLGGASALLFRHRCDPIVAPDGVIKSSFIRGQSELNLKIRCTSTNIRSEFKESLGKTGCIDQISDTEEYKRMIQIITEICTPDDVHRTPLAETIVSESTGAPWTPLGVESMVELEAEINRRLSDAITPSHEKHSKPTLKN